MSENANKIYGESKNFWKKVNVASYIFFLRLIGLWQSSSSPSIHHLNYLIFIITILNSIHQHLRLFSIHWKAMIFSIHWKAQIWKQVSKFFVKSSKFFGCFCTSLFPNSCTSTCVRLKFQDWRLPPLPIAKCVTSHLVRILETLPTHIPPLLLLPPVKVSDYITRECHPRLTFTIIVALPSSLQFLKNRTKKHHFNQLKKICSPIVFLMTSYFLALGIFSVFLKSILGSSGPHLALLVIELDLGSLERKIHKIDNFW